MRIYLLDNTDGEEAVPFSDETYKCSSETIEGFCGGVEALKQSMEKELTTERCQNVIYSWAYGIEAEKLIGKGREYVKAELKRMVSDCLLRDDRVVSLGDFDFDFDGDICRCEFDVRSKFGDIKTGLEVNV